MADIFISFASEDRSRVEPLAKALNEQGWSVWWDRRIMVGESFEDVIEQALDKAKCVIVVWSVKSVNSKWVSAEAEEGLIRRILVPVLIDKTSPPQRFILLHTPYLVGWDGSDSFPEYQKLIADIVSILGAPPVELEKRQRLKEEIQRLAEKKRKLREEKQRREAARRTEDERKNKEAEAIRRNVEAKLGDIFISYSRKDKGYVLKLIDHLEKEGLSIWVDDRIDHGDRWWKIIVTKIRNCSAMVVVMTSESEKTKWVEREMMFADKIEKPIFPLLLEGECFPLFVNQQYHDVRDGSMPPKAFIETLRQCGQ